MQRKEVRIALAVVGVLLAIFAGALVWHLGFSGPSKSDQVAAAPDAPPKDPPDKREANPDAGRESETSPEAPTVLTATKSESGGPAPSPQVHDAPSHEGLGWQGPYAGRDSTTQPDARTADESPYASPAAPDAFSGYAAEAGDSFGPGDDSPYGSGAEPQPEYEAERQVIADGHDTAPSPARGEERTTGAASRGSRNQLRSATAASGGNPLRGQAARSPAADQARATDPLAPDLSESPTTRMPTKAPSGQPASLDSGAWSYSPPEPASSPTVDPAETHDLSQRASAEAFAATAPAAAAAAQPRRLDAAAKRGASPAAPVNAEVVTASAEAEASAAEPATTDPPAPEGTYRVAARDTYWRIARRVYGDSAYYRALYEHNRKEHPRADRLAVGTLLEVPDLATLERLYPQFCPPAGPN